MKTIQNIVVSNVQPTSKSVLWADTSKSSKTPLKIYKDGSWVSCGSSGNNSKWSILKNIPTVGDVAYWDGNKVKTVPLSNWDSSFGTPVGVVIIPENFLPDGKARIMSLTYMLYNGVNSIVWDNTYSVPDTSVPNHDVVSLTDNAGSNSVGDLVGSVFLPSDKSDWSGEQSFVDPWSKYNGKTPYAPSPYMGDKLNPVYSRTIEGGNVLSDFNGLSNTQLLVNEGEQYHAAHACWDYKDSANSNLQWYLPAMGELGFLMPRFEVINNTLQGLSNMLVLSEVIPYRDIIWSSSECFNGEYYHTPELDTRNGMIFIDYRSMRLSVRSFAIL